MNFVALDLLTVIIVMGEGEREYRVGDLAW